MTPVQKIVLLSLALVSFGIQADQLASRYQSAYSLYQQRLYTAAIDALESLRPLATGHQLAPNIDYWIAESHYAQGSNLQAVQYFCQLIVNYPESEKGAHARKKMQLMTERGEYAGGPCRDLAREQPQPSLQSRSSTVSGGDSNLSSIEDANHCLALAEGTLATDCLDDGRCMKLWQLQNRCQGPVDLFYCYPLLVGSEQRWSCDTGSITANSGLNMHTLTSERFFAIACSGMQHDCHRFASGWIGRMHAHYPPGEHSTLTHPRVEWPREMGEQGR
jgi:hypothetical protein